MKKYSFLFLSLILSFSGSFGQSGKTAGATSQFLAGDSLKISLKKHISILSGPEYGGRKPMTHGDTLAVGYILEQFKAMDGVELLADGGLQTFGFGGLREYDPDSTWMSVGGRSLKIGTDFQPSPYSWTGGFAGEAVYLGAGRPEDFQGVDAKGKIVVIDGDLWKGEDPLDALFKWGAAAVKAKADGVVVISDDLGAEESKWALSTLLRFVKVSRHIGRQIAEGARVDYHAAIQNGEKQQTKTFNAVARIAASKENNPNHEAIVLGAHYDHFGQSSRNGQPQLMAGADDNASGTAALVELARYLSEARIELKRDVILVAFGAEESRSVGSVYFTQHPPVPLESVKAMVNLDMVGRMKEKALEIRGTGTAAEFPALLASLPNPDGLALTLNPSGTGPTDYASFYKKGIPALSFSTGIHPDYHSPEDTEDKIQYEGLKMTVDYARTLLGRLAFDTPVLTFRPGQD